MKLIMQLKFKKEKILLIMTFFGTALKITSKWHYPWATCSSTIESEELCRLQANNWTPLWTKIKTAVAVKHLI